MKNALIFLLTAGLSCLALAGEVRIAVAANFAGPAQDIASAFERQTGHKANLSTGATGKFHAQILNGAPFDVLLAADETTPAELERTGLALTGTRFTYAIGTLVLWSSSPERVDMRGEVLRRGGFKHLAIANPRTAPYGTAAIQTLQALKLIDLVKDKLVQGENIAQTHQFVSTGNADLGFVAYAQVFREGRLISGSAWVVPANLHAPIRQDAVQLTRSRDNPAAGAFLAYLRSEPARAIITRYGYALR